MKIKLVQSGALAKLSSGESISDETVSPYYFNRQTTTKTDDRNNSAASHD